VTKDADLDVDRVNNKTLEELTSEIWFQDVNVSITNQQLFDDVIIEGSVVSNVSTIL